MSHHNDTFGRNPLVAEESPDSIDVKQTLQNVAAVLDLLAIDVLNVENSMNGVSRYSTLGHQLMVTAALGAVEDARERIDSDEMQARRQARQSASDEPAESRVPTFDSDSDREDDLRLARREAADDLNDLQMSLRNMAETHGCKWDGLSEAIERIDTYIKTSPSGQQIGGAS